VRHSVIVDGGNHVELPAMFAALEAARPVWA